MSETDVLPGQTFAPTGDLASGDSLIAQNGTAGLAGGVIQSAGSVTSLGGIVLDGSYTTMAGSGAQMINSGTLVNQGSLSVGGGGGGTGGGVGATLRDSGVLSNAGALNIYGGSAGGAGSMTAAGGTLIDTGTLSNTGIVSLDGGAGGLYGGVGGTGAVLLDGGLLDNSGTLSLSGGGAASEDGVGGTGAGLLVGGVMTNEGMLSLGSGAPGNGSGIGGVGAQLNLAGKLTNTGTISLAGGSGGHKYGLNQTAATLTDRGLLINAGVLDIGGGRHGANNAVLRVGVGATLVDTGVISGGGTLTNLGLLTGAAGAGAVVSVAELFNDARIVSGPSMVIDSAISADEGQAGQIEVTTGGTLTLNGSIASSQTLSFQGAFGRVDLGTPDSFAATIDGFTGHDMLDLVGLSYVPGSTTASVMDGVLTVTDGAHTDVFAVTGIADGTVFTAVSDHSAHHGVLVEEAAQCFARGTRIRTMRGEIAVEDLHIGDLLVTLQGGNKPIKWIGRRSYEGRFIAGNHLMLPVCIRAGALAPEVPFRDLYVSPGHAMYIDGVLAPAWRLVNGLSITQAQEVEEITYVHLELEEHEVIFAEGAAAESFLDEGSRDQFQNAAEFALIYPAAARRGMPCVARVEDGFMLQAIQRRLATRAWIAEPVCVPGTLRGYLETAGPERLVGWAQDEANPEAPVCLDVFSGDRRVMRVLANRFRADVRAIGLGSGCHGFDLLLPPGLFGAVSVRRASDGAMLAAAAGVSREAAIAV